MTPKDKRNKAQYIRLLELMAIIGEEWGEAILSINDYNWKGQKIEDLENAIEELQQMISPMRELQGLLETMMKLKKNEPKKSGPPTCTRLGQDILYKCDCEDCN